MSDAKSSSANTDAPTIEGPTGCAGFEAREETRNIAWTWPGSAQEVWEQVQGVSAPFRPLFERVPPAAWESIHAEVLAALGRYRDGKQVKFGAVVVFATGAKGEGPVSRL